MSELAIPAPDAAGTPPGGPSGPTDSEARLYAAVERVRALADQLERHPQSPPPPRPVDRAAEDADAAEEWGTLLEAPADDWRTLIEVPRAVAVVVCWIGVLLATVVPLAPPPDRPHLTVAPETTTSPITDVAQP